jgi:hypothetical protein
MPSLYIILQVIGLIYCTVIGLMMMCVYLIILIRLTDYAIHFDDCNDNDNNETITTITTITKNKEE